MNIGIALAFEVVISSILALLTIIHRVLCQVNIPYTFLFMNFEYPDILRGPTGYLLTRFQEGGTGLLFTWFASALVGIPWPFYKCHVAKKIGIRKYALSVDWNCGWRHWRNLAHGRLTSLEMYCASSSKNIYRPIRQ